jgi:electron transport complex protein RnfB
VNPTVGRASSEEIDQLLPQTQCTKCGYNGCRPYAEAIAHDGAAINRCPPGGDATVAALARLTGQTILPLDRTRGEHKPLDVALIDEKLCIGCTLCIAACPVDAIIGAARQMHVVVADHCSGCELCIAPCPVDCITMIATPRAWDGQHANDARLRHEALAARPARLEALTLFKRQQRLTERHEAALGTADADAQLARKRAVIDAALMRARARRTQ